MLNAAVPAPGALAREAAAGGEAAPRLEGNPGVGGAGAEAVLGVCCCACWALLAATTASTSVQAAPAARNASSKELPVT